MALKAGSYIRISKLIKFPFYDTGHENIVKLLIENGADVNAVNMYNNTALILSLDQGGNFKFEIYFM